MRAALGTKLWAGNREQWTKMWRADHPIRWAWSTWRRHRIEYEERLGRPEFSRLAVLRVRRPRDAEAVIRHLCTTAPRP